ncbi:MAG TPA: spore coat protein U domain-containing protein [Stellaceae bacterium]
MAALLSTAVARAAAASCNGVAIGSFSPNPVSWRGSSTGYDPLDSTRYAQSVTFTVSKNTGPCTVIIGATVGDADSGTNRTLARGSNTLSFNLYTDSQLQNVWRNPPNATSNQVITYTFNSAPPHQTATLTFYYNIPPQQLTSANMLVPTGTYSRQVTFYVYTGTLNNPGSAVSSTNVNFQASVQSDMQVSVVPQGQSFSLSSTSQTVTLQTIDLQTAASGAVDLWVRANTGFKLQLASQNKGVMKYSANPADPSTVPYTLSVKVDGTYTPVNLNNTATLSAASGATGLGGNDYPISIAVTNLANTTSFPTGQNLPLAGSYADVVTITGIAQ